MTRQPTGHFKAGPGRSLRDLELGRDAAAATNAACVTGIFAAKNCSTASAYRRISRWAVSAARSETKFMSARALTVQKNSV